MNIPRGFRRLSVLAGLIGFAVMLVIGLASPEGHLAQASIEVWAWVTFLFAGGPAIFVLLLGWVVAGFQKSN